MFSNAINSLSNISPSFIKEICSRTYAPYDNTLFITTMLLLHNRVDNLKISYSKTRTDTKAENISNDPNEYSFYWFESAYLTPDELLNTVKNKFKSIEKLPLQEKFLSEELKQNISFRIMPSENTVCIFTDGSITPQAWHAVQFIIPKFFSVFKEKPLTQDETNFLMTLTQKRHDHYYHAASELANTDSFKRYILSFQLIQFEKKMYEKKVESAKENLTKFEDQMQKCLREYSEACKRRIEAAALVSGFEAMSKQHEDSSELQQYLLSNPHISNVTLTDSDIQFVAKTELVPYLVDEWEVLSKNDDFIIRLSNSWFNAADTRMLLNAILSEDRCLKLKMCAYFDINYFGNSVNSAVGYAYEDKDKSLIDYIPNPHLNLHNCFGQNATAILEQMKSGDVIGAIECAIACAQRVNIHEGFTFRPFVQSIFNCKGKCLVTEDGKEMTPNEALAYLKVMKND